MDGPGETLTIECGALRCRVEGFEDPFAALVALAPWLAGMERGDAPPDAPSWVGVETGRDAIVLRPAGARAPAARAASPFDPGADSIVFHSERFLCADRSATRAAAAQGGEARAPEADRTSMGLDCDDALVARLTLMAPGRAGDADHDATSDGADDRGPAREEVAPDGDAAHRSAIAAPGDGGSDADRQEPARLAPDGSDPEPDGTADLDAIAPGDGAPSSHDPMPAGNGPGGGAGDETPQQGEPDRMVIRLAEVTGTRIDTPEAERRRDALRHLRHVALADMDEAEHPADRVAERADGDAFDDRPLGVVVRPRRPVPLGGAPRVAPADGAGSRAPARREPRLAPLLLRPEHRVQDGAAQGRVPDAPPGPVRPRRVAPRRASAGVELGDA